MTVPTFPTVEGFRVLFRDKSRWSTAGDSWKRYHREYFYGQIVCWTELAAEGSAGVPSGSFPLSLGRGSLFILRG